MKRRATKHCKEEMQIDIIAKEGRRARNCRRIGGVGGGGKNIFVTFCASRS